MLTIQNVTKRYGGLIAVNDATMKVQEGRIVALIGPNGAGKTTLFAMIGGFRSSRIPALSAFSARTSPGGRPMPSAALA